MFKKKLFFSILIPFLCYFSAACVSIKLPTSDNNAKTTKYNNINFQPPTLPFYESSSSYADKVWLSQKTGNSLSYLSSCPAQKNDLELLQTDSISVLQQVQVVARKKIILNKANALETIYEGYSDEKKVRVALLSFIEHGCEFLVTYTGLEQTFDQEKKSYDDFKTTFKTLEE